jgi:MFS family permease
MDDAGDQPAGPLHEKRHDPYAALRFSDFRFFAAGNVAAVLGGQMVSVAIGWELYQQTNSATALGLVGLFQLIPLLLLSIPAGQLVDQLDRRKVVIVSQMVMTASALVLGFVSLWHDSIPRYALFEYSNRAFQWTAQLFGERDVRFDDPFVPVLFAVIFVQGGIRAFNQPAKSSLMPMIVPPSVFPNAVTWHSSGQELCSMIGPAIGGAIIAVMLTRPALVTWAYPTVYLLNAGLQLGQSLLLMPIKVIRPPRPHEKVTFQTLTAGIRYVAGDRVLLAALTLDLFAVVLGGSTALLPIFARDILHVGPAGLGWLRAAPSVGAVVMATFIAHLKPMQRAGRNLLLGVAGFGAAMIVFAVSKNFWLSLLMLGFTGAFDNVSVVVRHTLVQLRTPEAMRGRVSSVNAVFIGSSNQLGALESGLTAAAFGAVLSALLGGMGTIAVVIIAAVLWPEVRRLGAIHKIRPAESSEEG